MQTYYNGAKTGAFHRALNWSPASFGIPSAGVTSGDAIPDQCGDRQEALVMASLALLIQRADGGNGRNSLRHLLSYSDGATQQDAVRCSTCCWGGSNCAGIYETVHYMVQPAEV